MAIEGSTAESTLPAPMAEPEAGVAADLAPTAAQSIPAEAPETSSEPVLAAGPVATMTESPEMIEVWRPGRTGPQRRHRRPQPAEGERRRKPRPARVPAAGGAAAPGAVAATRAVSEVGAAPEVGAVPEVGPVPAASGDIAAATEPVPSPGEDRPAREHRRPREHREGAGDRERQHRDRTPRPRRPEPATGRAEHDRAPGTDRGFRSSRRDRPDRGDRGDRPDRDPELRAKYIKGSGDQGRQDKLPDPNSPFAKLAALKAQLEAEAKERR